MTATYSPRHTDPAEFFAAAETFRIRYPRREDETTTNYGERLWGNICGAANHITPYAWPGLTPAGETLQHEYVSLLYDVDFHMNFCRIRSALQSYYGISESHSEWKIRRCALVDILSCRSPFDRWDRFLALVAFAA